MFPIDKWKLLADGLGLEFKEGFKALFDSPSLQKIIMTKEDVNFAQIRKAQSILENPFFQSIIAKNFPGIVSGLYNGYETILFPAVTSSSNTNHDFYIHAGMFFSNPLNLGLNIKASRVSSRIGKKFGLRKYIRIPDNPILDDTIDVKGENRVQIQTYLRDNGVQDNLENLFMVSPDYKISDWGIQFKTKGNILSIDEARALLDSISEAVHSFY